MKTGRGTCCVSSPVHTYNTINQMHECVKLGILFNMTDIISFSFSARFTHRKPEVSEVEKLIHKMGWTANHPMSKDILQLWTPPSKEAIEKSKALLKTVRSQKWKGLSIKDFGEKGKGKKMSFSILS